MDLSLFFVSIAPAMKRHVYYLWSALKPSPRNKAKKTSWYT